jgi:hypothetical protein
MTASRPRASLARELTELYIVTSALSMAWVLVFASLATPPVFGMVSLLLRERWIER